MYESGNMFPFPAELLFDMREGNYAVTLPDRDKLTFVRLNFVKPYRDGRVRKYQGCAVLSTQHGEQRIKRFVVRPDGKYRILSRGVSEHMAAALLGLIMSDPRGSAARYGQELGHCCRCGKALTDERSRYYGIGPECERSWPDLIAEIDDMRGA